MPGFRGRSSNAMPVWLSDDEGNPLGNTQQGADASTQSGTIVMGRVVSGNQGYTVGTTQILNMEPGGRLKVAVSYAANVTPAAKAVSNDGAALIAGQYLATRPAWSDGFTGALQVSSLGDLLTSPRGGASLVTGQVSVPANTATQIVAARSGRQRVTISPTTNAAFYQGASNVSASTGLFVPAGASKTTETAAAVFVFSTAAITISFEELF